MLVLSDILFSCWLRGSATISSSALIQALTDSFEAGRNLVTEESEEVLAAIIIRFIDRYSSVGARRNGQRRYVRMQYDDERNDDGFKNADDEVRNVIGRTRPRPGDARRS
jgi:hypothetical protein